MKGQVVLKRGTRINPGEQALLLFSAMGKYPVTTSSWLSNLQTELRMKSRRSVEIMGLRGSDDLMVLPEDTGEFLLSVEVGVLFLKD